MHRLALALATICAAATPAAAGAAAEPSAAHPRLLLDDDLRAAWKRLAKDTGSAVGRAIARCAEIRKRPKDFARDHYMGLDWAQRLASCLVAHAATGDDAHAKTAMVYFGAMLDDRDVVGDGAGGDEAARRDSGFAMRAMGPYTALAYDWLHDHASMTDDLRAKARQRFAAWTDWYRDHGYRARSPGTNYQAGYLVAATFIAIAQGGEAGRAGARLWDHVVGDLWGKDMAAALAPGGLLDGGDWGEGWQYGPLSVAEYAVAARAIRRHGVEVAGVDRWLEGVLRRMVHGLSPADRVFIGGDTGEATANLPPPYLAFAAPLVGDATEEVWAWAKHEIAELRLGSPEFPLFEALAEARDVEARKVPRDQWPTIYLTAGVGNLYTRTHWGRGAVWMVLQCSKTIDVDHVHPNAGNLVVSRGKDDVIVDPSPYGSLSSLTSNAPTVASAHLPDNYLPSQAFWSQKTGFRWARQTEAGIVAARCDYADQYRFQHRPSDVPEAIRDIVLVPYAGGDAAAVVVIDRARSGDRTRPLHLRFRTEAKLALDGDVARGTQGGSALAIRRLASSSGEPQVRRLGKGDCFGAGTTRGGCDIPRFAVDEYRLVVDGPAMSAVHVIDAAAPSRSAPDASPVDGADGVVLVRDGRRAVIVAGTGADLRYTAPRGDAVHHVIVGAPERGGSASIAAERAGDGCAVTVSAGGDGARVDARPVIVVVDGACAIVEDPAQAVPLAASGGGTVRDAGVDDGTGGGDAAGGGAGPRSPRSGCCGAHAAPGPAAGMTALVLAGLALVLRARRKT
jgi:hypothetical protein